MKKNNKTSKVDLQSMSIIEEQKRKLRRLFPEVFNEKHINWEKLKATLGEVLDNGREFYHTHWPGKNNCWRIIQEQSHATLKPCKKESLDWDNTQNLFIEGDNLEVLKLLQASYYGKVKMIYIDPPYNTGKDFIYPDKYSENLETYLQYTGQKSKEGKIFSTNMDTDGRFHSKWLNMMFPRLYLARNLLREDGVIFISIDDNEVANLRKICDELFGEENFIGNFIINSTPNGRDYGHIAKNHELCLFYSKDIEQCKTNLLSTEKQFKYCDENGGFNIHPLYNSNEAFHKKNRPNLYYPFYLYKDNPIKQLGKNFYKIGLQKQPNSIKILPPLSQKNQIPFVWRWGKEKSLQHLNQEIIGYKTSNKNYRIVQKMRTDKKLIRSIILGTEVASRNGTAELEKLFNGKIFNFPKPVHLIKHFVSGGMGKNDIILDFFAGSGTTAHAVYEKNLEDGGNRKYICVQLPEPTQEKTESHKAGFKNIADIGKERIRRAIKKIKEENQQQHLGQQNNRDLGFKVFKLQKSHFKIWEQTTSKEQEISGQLEGHLNDFIHSKASDEDLLYEILLKTGYPLTTKIQPLTLSNTKIYAVENKALLICLERKNITKDLIKEMARLRPGRVIFLDIAFENKDHLKTNARETFASHGVLAFKTI